MQHRISDVDFAVSAPRTATIEVPEHVVRAAGHVGRAADIAQPELHSSIAGMLHQDDVAWTSAVGDEELRLAVVICTKHYLV